jgi:hypothetical protein
MEQFSLWYHAKLIYLKAFTITCHAIKLKSWQKQVIITSNFPLKFSCSYQTCIQDITGLNLSQDTDYLD